MKIGVGSGNPVKVAATERVLQSDHDEFGAHAEVVACPVESGVGEQPRGHDETRRGARNRALAVLQDGYDLGVGIEGGVTDRHDALGSDGDATEATAGDELYLIMWAAVADGERVGFGAGPSFPLPESIGERVRAGEELGPVMDDVLGEADVAMDQGAAGAVTGRRVDRTEALATAVAGALGPFVTELYE